MPDLNVLGPQERTNYLEHIIDNAKSIIDQKFTDLDIRNICPGLPAHLMFQSLRYERHPGVNAAMAGGRISIVDPIGRRRRHR